MKLTISSLAIAAFAFAPNAAAQLQDYSQDFESLDPMDGGALTNDGWLVFGNVYDPMGGLLGFYGPFGAPNGGAGFSAVASGAGGASQGAQHMNIYSDYNNAGAHSNGDYVEALVFKEQSISNADVGTTVTLSFDLLKNPSVTNGDGDTTTFAFIKVLRSSDGSFATLAFPTTDTTGASTMTWGNDSVSLLIDPSFEGELLQFGFASLATDFNDSGRFYDNVDFDAPGGGTPPGLSEYTQNFEGLDMSSGTALGADGWRIFGNVFDPMGGYLGGYGVFDAPNGGPGFSAIASGDGGPAQMNQYLSAYSDYNNIEHGNGNTINALLFQEQPISAADVGNTWRFAFDYRQNPFVNNGQGGTTTQAFIKVIQISNGSFSTLFLNEFDSTSASTDAWASTALDILIDPAFAGELIQFGYSSFATNYADSSRLYDNIHWSNIPNPGIGSVVCLGNPSSAGAGSLLTASGSLTAADNNVTLDVTGLPVNQMGMFVVSEGGVLVYNPATSAGHLCIASFAMGRYNGNVMNSGAMGTASLALDLAAVPSPAGPMAVMAGDTRAFQYWTRDTVGGVATSNFSSAVTMTFQ